MIPEELKSYIINMDDSNYDIVINTVKHIGFDKWFDGQINIFLNATKTFKTGERPVMTKYKTYAFELSCTLRMINLFVEESFKESYINKLIQRHKDNIKFEEENPYTYIPKITKKKSKSDTKTIRKQLKLEGIEVTDINKKETKANKKLKEHALKISNLTFNIIKHD